MKYYVYIYLNPLKPGTFVYENYVFLYKPFYVGYGSGNRIDFHIKEWVLNKDSKVYKASTNKKILRNKMEPIRDKLFSDISKDQAKKLEIKLIELIGRKDLGNGPLLNMTNGGDGGDTLSNHPDKEKIYEAHSARMSGNGNPFYGKTHTEDVKIKVAKSNRKRSGELHPNFGKQRSKLTKEKISISFQNKGEEELNEWKTKISDSLSGRRNPEHSRYMKERLSNPENHPMAKTYRAVSPVGDEFVFTGKFKQFCASNSLSECIMKRYLNKGKILNENVDIKRKSKQIENCLGWEISII